MALSTRRFLQARNFITLNSVKSKKISTFGLLRPFPYRSRTFQAPNHGKYASNFTIKSNFFHTSPPRHGEIVQFLLSDIGEGITEVSIKEWYIKQGDHVNQFDSICEVQSDKASVTITCRYDGTIRKLHYKVDDTAKVGKPLIDIELDGDGQSESRPSESLIDHVQDQDASRHSGKAETHHSGQKFLTTPAVRKMAIENNINLSEVEATGKDNRILKEDIIRHIEMLSKGTTTTTKNQNQIKQAKPKIETTEPIIKKTPPPSTLPLITSDRSEPIKGIRKAMATSMTTSLKIPHFSFCDEVDMTNLMHIRSLLKEVSKEHGVKMSFMPFFIKAASLAITKIPIINSTVDENCETITYKSSHNIGVAMDTTNGLVVPNIKDVQGLTVLEIAAELNRLQDAGAKGKLRPADITGGTFTLSNIGTIGGTYTKPIIFSPEMAIGAIGKIQTVPRYDRNNEIVQSHIMQISWSADHRIIDGATMARFSVCWKNYLENPITMILHLK